MYFMVVGCGWGLGSFVCQLLDFLALLFGWFFDWLVFFLQNDFNVARIGHVWVDTTVSSVGTSSHFGGFVHLDVGNSQSVSIQVLELSIALRVPEEIEDVLAGLLWEATNGCVVLFEE